jgi:hypothetical protein
MVAIGSARHRDTVVAPKDVGQFDLGTIDSPWKPTGKAAGATFRETRIGVAAAKRAPGESGEKFIQR